MDAATVATTMTLARPQRTTHVPTMLFGLALVVVGIGWFFALALKLIDGASVPLKAPIIVCTIGAAIFARGLAAF